LIKAMADDEAGEKTESPTDRRMGEARSDGMIPKSVELSQVLAIITAFLLLEHFSKDIWEKLAVVFKLCLSSGYSTSIIDMGDLRRGFLNIMLYLLPEILLMLVLTASVGSLTTLLQTKFNWSTKLLKPKFSMLNPVNGLKRLISVQNAVQTLKSILKLAIIAPVAYFGFVHLFPQILGLMDLPVTQLLPFTGYALSEIFWDIMKLMMVLAIADYAWQRYSVGKKLKMTKDQVKDEKKSIEGDERTKMQFRARALQRARQRMLQAVKTADVVVTNPTHFAVALLYEMEPGVAPKVVAKGADHMAEQIKKIARENRVPVVERKPLARALFASVEVGREIPYELFAAVAELLAYVYKIRGRTPFRNRKPSQQKRT
jgi:flagellar biosynthesis protein FlhB